MNFNLIEYLWDGKIQEDFYHNELFTRSSKNLQRLKFSLNIHTESFIRITITNNNYVNKKEKIHNLKFRFNSKS